MVQAYREGTLRPSYDYHWSSQIREEWLLSAIECKAETSTAIESLHVKSAFGMFMKDKAGFLKQLLDQLQVLGRLGEGDLTAMLQEGSSSTDFNKLQALWQAMQKGSIV